MSGSFTGFSEDDIRKLNKNPEESVKAHHVKGRAYAQGSFNSRPQLTAQRRNSQQSDPRRFSQHNEVRYKILNDKIQSSPVEPIVESAKLSKPSKLQPAGLTTTEANLPIANRADKHNPQTSILSSVENFHLKSEKPFNKTPQVDNTISQNTDILKIDNNEKEEETHERKLDLDGFQARQKLIEEQNRRRKELLEKALAVKTKQTQEETQRLNMIREEFKKLDALLSTDVKILRKQIEVASLDYMEAQKRYFKIEKEFLEAKLVLHQKVERKELLTEHLCAIIEKNEERKAEKLNELLLKLNLKADLQEDTPVCSNNNAKQSTDTTVEVATDKAGHSDDSEKQSSDTKNLEVATDNVSS